MTTTSIRKLPRRDFPSLRAVSDSILAEMHDELDSELGEIDPSRRMEAAQRNGFMAVRDELWARAICFVGSKEVIRL